MGHLQTGTLIFTPLRQPSSPASNSPKKHQTWKTHWFHAALSPAREAFWVCDECPYFSGVLTSLLGASNDDNLRVLVMVKRDMKKILKKAVVFFFLLGKNCLLESQSPKLWKHLKTMLMTSRRQGLKDVATWHWMAHMKFLGCCCFLACFYSSPFLLTLSLMVVEKSNRSS